MMKKHLRSDPQVLFHQTGSGSDAAGFRTAAGSHRQTQQLSLSRLGRRLISAWVI